MDLGALRAACAVVALFIGFPRTLRAGLDGNAETCVNNLRRLGVAWAVYASDNQGRVVNNFMGAEMQAEISKKTYRNWTHNAIDWTLASSNTNQSLARTGKLSPYHDNDVSVLHCPSDTFASAQQKARGWAGRIRSYSMNGFMGSSSAIANDPSNKGDSSFATGYRQFLVTSAISSPFETMLLLDEHPDTINDGFFINLPTNSSQWVDLPASHHDGGAGVAFADGSAVIRLWQSSTTRLPVKYGAPFSTFIPPAERGDCRWLTERMAVSASTLAVHKQTNETIELVWSANPVTFQLQSMNTESGEGWQTVPGSTIRGLGRASKTVAVGPGTTFFRLVR